MLPTELTPQFSSLEPNQGESLPTVAKRLAMSFIDLAVHPVDLELLKLFPARVLFRETALPIERSAEGRIRVALSDPYNLEAINELEALSDAAIEAVLAEPRQIEAKLNELLGVAGGTISDLVLRQDQPATPDSESHLGSDEADGSEPSVVRLVNELLIEALAQRASDVHLEPSQRDLSVRFRVDGQLRVQPMPEELHRFRSAIISRLKIMARLNIAEKRVPQDGRIKLNLQSRQIDVRLSVIPMLYGEGVVLRLLDQSRAPLNLHQLGVSQDVLHHWQSEIRRPHGLVLVTGPTGSGKTTTLYASLSEISNEAKKIVTIEDPVEYHLGGISQIQVHNKVGLTFASGLRSVLRHDPDVVLIGEIRDAETAVSAVQAALTGHLVFSTLHTNDSASAFTRLIDMGIEPYLVASTINAVLAQRLVRRLCHHCRQPVDLTSVQLPGDFPQPDRMLADASQSIYTATGCRHCHGTGYAGRLAIYELLRSNPSIRQLAGCKVDSMEIRSAAFKSGMRSLRQSGWEQVARGETTIDEVLRVASEAEFDDSLHTSAGEA